MSALSTYDVEAIIEQPAGTVWFVLDGTGPLLARTEALRALNTKPAYHTDHAATRLLDSAERYAMPVLVSIDRSSWSLITEPTDETPGEVNARLMAIARGKAGYK